jgi:histidinol phosphatase-like PHP family hydrolase
MTGWQSYERYLTSGLWHVHTERTDGTDRVDSLVSFARSAGFPLLGIVEHVREELTYDFDALYEEAKRAAPADLQCVVGCEAKVLDVDGTLDCPPAVEDRADVVYAAYHGTPFSKEEYVESIRATLRNPTVDVWAHPFAYAARQGFTIDAETCSDLAEEAAANDVLIELNLSRPNALVDRLVTDETRRIVGYDLHDVDSWQ